MEQYNILQKLARVKISDLIHQINSNESFDRIKNQTQKIAASIAEKESTQHQESITSSYYISRPVRVAVFTRDNYQCVCCHRNSQQIKLQIDFVVPLSQGGSKDADNLQTVCIDCNSPATDRMVPSFA